MCTPFLIQWKLGLNQGPPEFAVDGNLETQWSAGSHPPQWIEVDLQTASSVQKINLVVDQDPDGQTRHQIWGKGENAQDPYQLLHEFNEDTKIGQVLEHTFAVPWIGRFIKVETVESPSWVSWREIEIITVLPTGISLPETAAPPQNFELRQNYPNPFNPETTIQYQLSNATQVKLVIFNIRGEQVNTLVDDLQQAGFYSVPWNGKDVSGRKAASGVYFYRLETKRFAKIKKMVLIQ